MRFMSKRRVAIAVWAAGLCVALAAPAVAANNDNGQYPSEPDARTFNGGPSGWTASSSFDGSCIPPVLCPSVTNEYVAGGDAESSGYISSNYLGVAGVGAVAGTTTGTWESPAFTYQTADNGPEEAFFAMSRRADVGQLLAVAGNSANYAVQLVDLSEGEMPVQVISPTTMAGAGSWTTVPRVTIKAGRLHSGDSYKVRIQSIYKTGTSVVADGAADYDNVVLRTAAAEAANGGGGSGSGEGNGSGGGNGRKELRSSELLGLFSSGQSSTATLTGGATGGGKGKVVLVKISCPKKIGRACRVTAQGLLKKHKPATAKRTVKVGKGKSRRVALRVKPKARAKVAKRKRLLIGEKVKVGKTTATAYKVRKLIRR